MCAQLTELGCAFAPSSYYEARFRPPSARALRDEALKRIIAAEYDDNYRVYGARKMWLRLRGMGIDVARCTVERLMRALGLRGARRGTVKRNHHRRPGRRRGGGPGQAQLPAAGAQPAVGGGMHLCIHAGGLGSPQAVPG